MTTTVVRVICPFDETNPNIEADIQGELTTIDGLGGTVISYCEYFDFGMNDIIYTILYTLP